MKYIPLRDLHTYKLARELSVVSWSIYTALSWSSRKLIGDQFIRSTDSVGANIAEGYGRFHYLDRRRFYYNSRGSLLESFHWYELLHERSLITDTKLFHRYNQIFQELQLTLAGFINSLTK